jgi:hypothetical protein
MMKPIWDRIHKWLIANAPSGYGDLRPGASATAIEQAEKAIGLKLPGDVVASYRIHDGQATEPGLIGAEGWRLLSLQEIVEQWGHWTRANPQDAVFVPIAWGEMGDFVFLNLDPRSEDPGCLRIQRRDMPDHGPLVPSFSCWLEDFADELEEGVLVYSEDHGGIILADELDLD